MFAAIRLASSSVSALAVAAPCDTVHISSWRQLLAARSARCSPQIRPAFRPDLAPLSRPEVEYRLNALTYWPVTRSSSPRATGSPQRNRRAPALPRGWGSPLSLPPFASLLPRSRCLLFCVTARHAGSPQSGTEKPCISQRGMRGFFYCGKHVAVFWPFEISRLLRQLVLRQSTLRHVVLRNIPAMTRNIPAMKWVLAGSDAGGSLRSISNDQDHHDGRFPVLVCAGSFQLL